MPKSDESQEEALKRLDRRLGVAEAAQARQMSPDAHAAMAQGYRFVGEVVGGVLGYFGLQFFAGLEPTLLGIVAASMIYVAVADLIPGLHRRPHLRDTASQALLIALGIGTIAAAGMVLQH